MESRMEKYYREDNSEMQRSSKNAKLYREVYQNYDSLDNLPIPDNTNEIDIPALKKMMHNNEETLTKTREMKFANLEEEISRPSQSEQKIHDINKLLEYAKNENNKLKEQTTTHENTSNYKLLQTLENKALTKEEITSNYNSITKSNNYSPVEAQISSNEENNELKYQTKKISVNPSIDQIITSDTTSSLSLDILSDLKPNGDTGVTKPITNNNSNNDILEEDIDIIKDNINLNNDTNNNESTFYTDTYKFSNKDFDDDFYDDNPKNHYVIKIIILIFFIGLCAAAIFYFISNYGLN